MDEALDRAVVIFRQRGYHATSISELAAAMGLTQGSIYKAFKDKRAVFLAAFDRNKAVRAEKLASAIAGGQTGLQRLRRALAERVRAALARNETLLAGLIALGQADGSIPAEIDRAATARTMLCLLQGMRVVGKTGRSRPEMDAVVEVALRLLG
jgi:AcrR family transcriptional regulator